MRSIRAPRLGRAAGGLLLLAAASGWPATTGAAPPQVAFDVSYSVQCRDVTSEHLADVKPGEKIVEARFQISLLLKSGAEQDIQELIYVIWSPEKRLRVADFAPKTQMESQVANAVEVVETGETTSSLDGSLALQIEPLGGVRFSPSAGASRLKKQNLQQKYSRLPPKQLLVASGTILREHGVFFKQKPSTQASLEGQREFVCLFAVPESWRAGYAYVDCSARLPARSPWSRPPSAGSRRVLVGLHLQGDAEARQAAERLASAHEAYLRAGRPPAPLDAQLAAELTRLVRRLPGLSLVESLIGELAAEDEKTAQEQHEAWESLSAAREELGRLAG